MRKAIWLAALMAISAPIYAQVNSFTINHNGATYTEGNLAGAGTRTDGGTADFFTGTPGSPDNIFQNWWWYRRNNDNREFALGNLVFLNSSGNRAEMVFFEQGLQFHFEYTLTSLSPSLAMLQIGWKIENRTQETIGLNFFSYTDYDLNGNSGNDSGTFIAPNQFQVTDPAGVQGILTASSSNLVGWEQGSFPSVLNKLTNAGVDNLANGVPAFGPADWTGAFQWERVLAPLGSPNGADQFVGSLVKIVNNPVPEPATLVALGLGAVAMIRRRRK